MDFSRFTSVTSDSREAGPGSLFVAVAGGTKDGHDFIDEVISHGAAAIIGERPLEGKLKVPYTQVADSRLALAEAAAEFYQNPSRSMKVAGITGTSGKTTTTYLVESILHAAGFKVGVIGTVNFRYGTAQNSTVLPSTHTTPGPVELQKIIAQMKSKGVTHLVMEISSHALRQKRVHGISFQVGAFTNLSPEHLDFHRDMEDYFEAKSVLFKEFSKTHVVNGDDPYGQRLAVQEGAVTFGLTRDAGVSGAGLDIGITGIHGPVALEGHTIQIRSGLLGCFNAMNILAAIGIAKGLGVAEEAIIQGVERLHGVPGRLERVENSKGFHVFVDYAHKPDALEKVLRNLQVFRGDGHRLITVFGCGGDRDRTKRPVMGRIAQELSDFVIVTSDNPRTEAPGAIIDEITTGMSEKPGLAAYEVEPDRRRAIERAVHSASKGDLLLIAGKGHEDYQIIGTQKHPFDDRKVAAEALKT